MLPLPLLGPAAVILPCPGSTAPSAWCRHRTPPGMPNRMVRRLSTWPGFTGTLWQQQTATTQSSVFPSSAAPAALHGYIYGRDGLSQPGKQGFMQIRLIHNPCTTRSAERANKRLRCREVTQRSWKRICSHAGCTLNTQLNTAEFQEATSSSQHVNCSCDPPACSVRCNYLNKGFWLAYSPTNAPHRDHICMLTYTR